MRVILNQDIKGIGKKLDKVEVSEGYARNYLLPRKLAVAADTKAELEANSKKQAIKFKQDTERGKALEIKERIEQTVIEFRLKNGENGKLFGSVTNKEIKEKLDEKLNIDFDKKKIELENVIKSEGMFNANIKLYEGVVAKLKIKVVGI